MSQDLLGGLVHRREPVGIAPEAVVRDARLSGDEDVLEDSEVAEDIRDLVRARDAEARDGVRPPRDVLAVEQDVPA